MGVRIGARWATAMLGVCLSAPATADVSRVVLSVGDCSSGELLSLQQALTTELQATSGNGVLAGALVQQRLGLPAELTPAALERKLEAAQRHFYNAQYARAARTVADALEQIERLPPGEVHVRLRVRAELMLGLALRGLGNLEASSDAFGRVLRVHPNHRLDPNWFAPSIRGRFERLRQELRTGRHHRLAVSAPEGPAEVYLNGVRVGTTPYSGLWPEGAYQLRLSARAQLSFPRRVELTSDRRVEVNVPFEASVDMARSPCVDSAPDEPSRHLAAVRFGVHVAADQVVLVRLERTSAGVGWLAAAVVEVETGQRLREAGLKLKAPGVPIDGLPELARFVLTGRGSEKLLEGAVPSAAAPALSVTAVPRTGAGESARVGGWPRTAGQVSVAAGLSVLAAATVFQVRSAQAWSEFNRSYANQTAPSRAEAPRLAALDARARQERALAGWGFLLGGVATAAGAWLWAGAPGVRLGGMEGADVGAAVSVPLP